MLFPPGWVAAFLAQIWAPGTRHSELLDDLMERPGTKLTVEQAKAHVAAAIYNETPDAPADVMLSIAWRESRYHPLAGPRKKLGGSGPYLWPVDHTKIPKLKHYICGFMQTTMATRADCLSVREPMKAYSVGAESLGRWADLCRKIVKIERRRAKRAGEDVRRWSSKQITSCKLAGYAKGTKAAKRKLGL